MGRRWRGASVAAAVAVAAAILFAVRSGRPQGEGRVQTLWRAPWGPGGVATALAADGRTYGPLAWAVGRTHVVLADSFNRRLLFVPLAGGPAEAVDLGPDGPLVESLAVAPDGAVDLADRGGTLWRWSPGAARAEPAARLAGAGDRLALARGLAFLPQGGLVVDLLTLGDRGAARSVFVLLPDGRRRPVAQPGAPAPGAGPGAGDMAGVVPVGGHALAVGPGGDVYLLGFDASGRRVVQRFDPQGRLLAVTPLPAGSGGPGEWSLLGVDRTRRMYLGLELGRPQGLVLVLDPRGRVRRSLPVPMEGGVRLGVYARAGEDGSVYTLSPSAEGIGLQRRWPPGSRPAAP